MEIYKNLSLEDLEGEAWKFIPDCDDLYMVSNMGRIKSLASVRKFGNKKRRHKERILKQFPNWQGYLSCFNSNLSQNKIRVMVHKIVCNVFVENPNNYPCVNHKDENKQNNKAENLEHCTFAYNLSYGSRRGLRDVAVLQYDKNGDLIGEHKSVKEASLSTNTNPRGISNAIHGWAKSAGGYIWRIKGQIDEQK
jgi:hypothetical protein